MNIKGIIFDYGGTIDSRGVHWSEIIWDGYCKAGADRVMTKDQFREACDSRLQAYVRIMG